MNDQRNQLLQAAASQAAEAKHQAIESTTIEADHYAQIEIRKAHEAATAQAEAEHAIRIQEFQAEFAQAQAIIQQQNIRILEIQNKNSST